MPTCYFTGTAQVWQMGLVPHDATLSKRVGKVTVSGGGRDIQRLENRAAQRGIAHVGFRQGRSAIRTIPPT